VGRTCFEFLEGLYIQTGWKVNGYLKKTHHSLEILLQNASPLQKVLAPGLQKSDDQVRTNGFEGGVRNWSL
jgi:hypothetical protein